MIERHGIDLNNELRAQIRGQIHSGRSSFVRKCSNNRSIHAVEIAGKTIQVVWDKKRQSIITVLPEGDEYVALLDVYQ